MQVKTNYEVSVLDANQALVYNELIAANSYAEALEKGVVKAGYYRGIIVAIAKNTNTGLTVTQEFRSG